MISLYFDCSRGLSGQMIVGALCDVGAKPSAMEWELAQVDLGSCHTHFERETEAGVTGVRFTIHEGAEHTPDQNKRSGHEHAHHHQHHGEHDDHLPHRVDKLLVSVNSSALSDPVKIRVASVFTRLGQTHDALSLEEAAAVICASAAIYALKPGRVAFFNREGTMDATVDAGAAFAAEFVSSSTPMPDRKPTAAGCGLGVEGQSMRVVLADVPV